MYNRYHLKKHADMNIQVTQINNAIHDRLPPRIINSRLRIAIDLNLIPYYGVPTPAEVPYIISARLRQAHARFMHMLPYMS